MPGFGFPVTNLGESEMQLRMVIKPEEAIHMFPKSPEHLIITADNNECVQDIENDLRACTNITRPTIRGLNKPKWRSFGAALRFSVFRIVIKRQACRAHKRQKLY